MNFPSNRASAIKKLDDFIENNLLEYTKLRNFDFGFQNRNNTSCLSPCVTHGVISEIEIINKVLKKHLFNKSEKFIQEVLWRIYWKGWLELRPEVWDDFLINLKTCREKYKLDKFPEQCVETTKEWSKHWVNDRIHQRRPFLVPNFYKIDKLLSKYFDHYFDHKFE